MAVSQQAETESHYDELFDLFHHHFHWDNRMHDLFWKVPTTTRIKPGTHAGHLHKNGVIVVGFYNEVYKVHRVAHFMVTGMWPMTGKDTREHLIGALRGYVPKRRGQ